MRSILQVGNESTLRTIGHQRLELTGAYLLASSTDEALLRHERFDLVVFCHTVSLEQREKISRAERELYVDVRVLNVLPLSAVIPAPDEAAADPERFLAKVNEAPSKHSWRTTVVPLSASTSVWISLSPTSRESLKRMIRQSGLRSLFHLLSPRAG